jgi:hypothetical protein
MKNKKEFISEWLKRNAESDQMLASLRESVFLRLEKEFPQVFLTQLSLSFIQLEDELIEPTISDAEFLIKSVGTHFVRTWAHEYLISKTVASGDE